MEIRINGRTADISLDNEKTVGEVLSGLEQWLSGSGHRLSGLSVDGSHAGTFLLDEIFNKEIDSVQTLDISTSSIAELAAESLLTLLDDIKEYKNLDLREKNNFLSEWKEKAQAQFILEQMPDLHEIYTGLFSNQADADTVFSITEERLREVRDPKNEFNNLQPLIEETCSRLIDFALDIQTGKDVRAAQTIQIFSGVAEKVLRILRQLEVQGYLSKEADGGKPINLIIGEFGKLTEELLNAYQKHDTVLVGDLAEYEAAVKLKELSAAIKNNSCCVSALETSQQAQVEK